MFQEPKYAFRARIDEVHPRNIRDAALHPAEDETVVSDAWRIVTSEAASPRTAASDLRSYLVEAMNLELAVVHGGQSHPGPAIELAGSEGRSYTLEVGAERIVLRGDIRRAVYALERAMTLREAPFLRRGTRRGAALFGPRMVHSGWGVDQFPDRHLNAIAHAGFDSVIIFVKGVDLTTHGVMDFNDLVRRAGEFGLGVYFYSYLESFKHPDEPDAEAFFDRTYGAVFAACPGAKGLILVGESCHFPSRDPRTSGRRASYVNAENDGLADARPAPGMFPCSDYPQWLEAVKKAVHKYAPAADIVFWTYNWGNADREARLELIRHLPRDVSLEVTFEMFSARRYPRHTKIQPDYSITFPGPGEYFTSEAEAAHARGLRLYSMTNTAGMTWDCGVVPYIPVPQQWIKRFLAIREARRKWGVSGLMESHHYGWYPSVIAECAAECFTTESPDPEAFLRAAARRDFGGDAAPKVLAAWQMWSDAINSYTPGFDDQAGPLRVGAAYPLVLNPILYPHTEQKMAFPTTPQSAVGARWLHAFYQPEQVYGETNCGRRIYEDIRIIFEAVSKWNSGSRLMDEALALVPSGKRRGAELQSGVGRFFGCALHTMLAAKRWWLLNKQLEIECDFARANALLDEMVALIHGERANVKRAIPLAAADSRLGWEPSMDYMADVPHLNWKLRQLENLEHHTLAAYRRTLSVTPEK